VILSEDEPAPADLFDRLHPPEIRIGIVGHVQREEMALDLYNQVDADFLSIDPLDGIGCLANHLAVWRWHADNPGSDFCLVLEDDAVPVEDFRHQLAAALAVAPTPIVSLYLGRGYIGDTQLSASVRRAEATGSHWLLADHRLLHAVGLAVRRELLPSMITELSRRTHLPRARSGPIDHMLGQWARRNHHEVAYTVPSLVDHADGPSLVMRHRRAPRTAWRTGGREQWTSTSTPMN